MKPDPKNLKRSIVELKDTVHELAAVRSKLAPAATEFGVRYFRWCLAEVEAECGRGFGFVSKVRDSTVPVFLEYVEPLEQSERLKLVRILCKRLHQPDSLTLTEKQEYERYLEFFTVPFRHPSGTCLPSTRIPADQLERQKRFIEQKPDRRTFRRKLSCALKSAATSEFGAISVDRPTLLCYEKAIGDWHLVTSFEMGRLEQLRYQHRFHALSGGHIATSLAGGISILSWTGIVPDTSWSCLLLDEIGETVEAAHTFCSYFIQRADKLIARLPNPLLS